MSKYYYNTEFQKIEDIDTIRSDYFDLFAEEYETFDHYLECCMTYNNGVLIDIRDRDWRIKKELNRKLELAQKYGMEEYIEELAELLEEHHMLTKLINGKA